MPVYTLTSWHGDIATIESPNLEQAKKDGAFILKAYGRPSGKVFSRNGRYAVIYDSDVLFNGNTTEARLDERFGDFVDEYRLKPGQNIGDYVIHSEAAYDYDGEEPLVDIWCEAVNVMDTFDAGYLDFRIPVEYLFSSRMTWDELKAAMTYTYDAAVTDRYADNGFWGDEPEMESIVGDAYRKGRSKARSKAVQRKGRTGNGAGHSFVPERKALSEQLNLPPLYMSRRRGGGSSIRSSSERQSTFEVDPPRNNRKKTVRKPADKGRPYSRETTVGKDGKKRPPVKTLHCTPRISDYRSPKTRGDRKGAGR